MNRSTIGDYLQEVGFKRHTYTYGARRNTYHVYSKPTDSECILVTKYCYIKNIEDIYLCTSEIMILGKFGEMKINIPYIYLDDLEIRVFPYDEGY